MVRTAPHRRALDARASFQRPGPAIALLATAALASVLGACVIDTRSADERWVCTEGACECAEGWGDCDGDVDTGCEVDTSSDPNHCGGCFQRCVNGQCVVSSCSCDQDYANCDQLAATGCEVNLRTDPLHCGECERDCAGGACLERVCQPIVMVDTSYMYGLALTATHAFWTDGGVWSYRLDGSEEPQWLVEDWVTCLAARDDHVYWLAENEVKTMAVGDAAPTIVADSPPTQAMCSLAVTADHVIWVPQSGSPLLRVPHEGGPSVELAPQVDLAAADDDHAYWLDYNATFFRAAAGSNTPERLFSALPDYVDALALGPRRLYWSYRGDGEQGGVRMWSGPGQAVATLFESDPFYAYMMVADADGVYVACDEGPYAGAIVHVDPTTHESSSVAIDQVGVNGMALTGQYVYWTTRTQLLRLPR